LFYAKSIQLCKAHTFANNQIKEFFKPDPPIGKRQEPGWDGKTALSVSALCPKNRKGNLKWTLLLALEPERRRCEEKVLLIIAYYPGGQ
jgi:hypothetical protein